MLFIIDEYSNKLMELAKGIVKSVNNVLNGKDINDPIPSPKDPNFKELFVLSDKNPIISVNQDLIENPRDLNVTTDVAYNM